MSCGTSACKCDTGFPLASGITGTLGFTNTSCCRAPCPAFPIHHVKICIRINEYTSVRIQQGCAVGTNPLACEVDYNWGLIENSWGRTCRLVEWNRKVPSKTFVRLRLCAADSCSSCNEQALTLCGKPINNELVKFEVDGVDYVSVLQAILVDGGSLGCIKVGCGAHASTACCERSSTSFNDLADMRVGAEITFGPIGSPIIYVPSA